MPVDLREPSQNVGAGEARGRPPHLTGEAFLKNYGIAPRSAAAYALTSDDFVGACPQLWPHRRSRSHGHRGQGGARRARQDRVLLLDGGDSWQGSLTANRTKGQDIIDCLKLLRPDAMTGHWEFTYGEARLKELIERLGTRSSRSTSATPNGRSRCSMATRCSTRAVCGSPCSARRSPTRRSPIRAG